MQKRWWVAMGYPEWEAGSDGGPRPGQVITYFRLRKIMPNGKPCTQKDVAAALGISEQAVIKKEKRDAGLDSIEERQFFIDTFAIPYELMQLAPKPEQAGKWWIARGYPAWDEGPDKFPRPGQVTAHFRRLKLKADGKPWTQKDLALALGISEQSVIKMENHDVGMDSVSRRQFLIEIFGIPYILMRMAPPPSDPVTRAVVAAVSQVVQPTIHTVDLVAFGTDLHEYWTSNHSRTASASLLEISTKIAVMYEALEFTKEKYALREMLCRYHILIGNILRDQQRFKEAVEHLNRALKHAKTIQNDELRVDALFRRGGVYGDWSHRPGNTPEQRAYCLNMALKNYRAAEKLLKKAPYYMGGGVLLELGHAEAEEASLEATRRVRARP